MALEKELALERVSFDQGVKAGKELAMMTSKPDAVIASDDVAAAGICEGIRSCGLRVPEDVSIVSYGGSLIAKACAPQLASVVWNIELKSCKALHILANPYRQKENFVLPVSLSQGRSVADRNI
jgi:LacI family repressor for deo operon, udp, cdd, tsx, nupC, and nupG